VTLNSQPSFYFGRRNERCKSVQWNLVPLNLICLIHLPI
jgi:hypothetical protein